MNATRTVAKRKPKIKSVTFKPKFFIGNDRLSLKLDFNVFVF